MSEATQFRWEQDGAGGEHGTATYFVGRSHEVTVPLPTFAEAHKLHEQIEAALTHARYWARNGLLSEIGRIQP